jgi:hypothetical protein
MKRRRRKIKKIIQRKFSINFSNYLEKKKEKDFSSSNFLKSEDPQKKIRKMFF